MKSLILTVVVSSLGLACSSSNPDVSQFITQSSHSAEMEECNRIRSNDIRRCALDVALAKAEKHCKSERFSNDECESIKSAVRSAAATYATAKDSDVRDTTDKIRSLTDDLKRKHAAKEEEERQRELKELFEREKEFKERQALENKNTNRRQ